MSLVDRDSVVAIASHRKDPKAYIEPPDDESDIRMKSREIRYIEDLLDELYKRYPYRVGRIRGDMKWLAKQAVKRRHYL